MSEQLVEHKADEASTLADFLEDVAPTQPVKISDLVQSRSLKNPYRTAIVFKAPDIQLHCSSEHCNGVRFFRCVSGFDEVISASKPTLFFVVYRCSNCRTEEKTYALAAQRDDLENASGQVIKFGEAPPFGPPVPPKLIKLIGPDRDSFLKGRRCENQGLGVGAFVYYRRVIENQKNRIIGQIVSVSEKLKAAPELIAQLKAAMNETRFSESLNMAKGAIPESLMIDGHSPLQLLHGALSEGVHSLSDQQCLELAGSIRVVLGELSERLSQALKDEAELSKALTHLMHHKKSRDPSSAD